MASVDVSEGDRDVLPLPPRPRAAVRAPSEKSFKTSARTIRCLTDHASRGQEAPVAVAGLSEADCRVVLRRAAVALVDGSDAYSENECAA
jgi:hypothetical protein